MITLTEKYPPLSWDELRDINRFINCHWHPKYISELILKLVKTHPFISLDLVASQQIFWRARQTSKSSRYYDNVSQLLWPPPHFVSAGRANLRNESLLYISDRRDTALSELLNTRSGDVHFVGIKIIPQRTVRLVIIGEMFHIYRTGKGLLSSPEQAAGCDDAVNACPLDEARRIILGDVIVFDLFCKLRNHKITTLIAKTIRDKMPYIDRFTYLSVRQYGCINIALSPVSYLTNWGIASVFRASSCKHISHGLWNIDGRNHAMDIDESGNIPFSNKGEDNIACHVMPSLFLGGGNPHS